MELLINMPMKERAKAENIEHEIRNLSFARIILSGSGKYAELMTDSWELWYKISVETPEARYAKTFTTVDCSMYG